YRFIFDGNVPGDGGGSTAFIQSQRNIGSHHGIAHVGVGGGAVQAEKDRVVPGGESIIGKRQPPVGNHAAEIHLAEFKGVEIHGVGDSAIRSPQIHIAIQFKSGDQRQGAGGKDVEVPVHHHVVGDASGTTVRGQGGPVADLQ